MDRWAAVAVAGHALARLAFLKHLQRFLADAFDEGKSPVCW